MKGPNREAIGARLRFDVLRRCNFACYYCGVPASLGLKQLHVDHVIPVALGGTNDPWNLVAACWDCNAGKTNTVPSEELVRQVRDDYCAFQSPLQAVAIDQCKHCRIPIAVYDDEDNEGQCVSCNEWGWTANEAGFRLGWDRGYERAAADLGAFLRQRDGGEG